MNLRGKQIKDYVIGEVTVTQHSMHLMSGKTTKGQPVSILVIDKGAMEQTSFVSYVNMLQ
jgi:hypothetical protein